MEIFQAFASTQSENLIANDIKKVKVKHTIMECFSVKSVKKRFVKVSTKNLGLTSSSYKNETRISSILFCSVMSPLI